MSILALIIGLYRVVWKTVKEKIPELYKVIEDLIRDLEIEL
jgi:uncharacterized protein with HEPN domain